MDGELYYIAGSFTTGLCIPDNPGKIAVTVSEGLSSSHELTAVTVTFTVVVAELIADDVASVTVGVVAVVVVVVVVGVVVVSVAVFDALSEKAVQLSKTTSKCHNYLASY